MQEEEEEEVAIKSIFLSLWIHFFLLSVSKTEVYSSLYSRLLKWSLTHTKMCLGNKKEKDRKQ